MYRGGSRWSIAIGALFGLSMLLPAAVRAATPLTITLVAAPTTAFTDQVVTLTATTSPAVADLQINFIDSASTFFWAVNTDNFGTASVTMEATANQLAEGQHFVHATFFGDDVYGPATSNTVEVDLNQHPSAVALSYGDPAADPVIYGVDDLVVYARVTEGVCVGEIDLAEYQAGVVDAPDRSGTAHSIVNQDGSTGCGFDFDIGPHPAGSFQFQATFGYTLINAGSVSPLLDVAIIPITTATVVVASPNPVEVGSDTLLTATITSPEGIAWIDGNGTITFFDGTSELGTSNVGAGAIGKFDAVFSTLGSHLIRATYNGSSRAEPSTSAAASVSVVPNTVHATDLGVSASTFYPVPDGYGDQLVIQGILGETATVRISITNATTGALERSFLLTDRGAGYYNFNWDGRPVISGPIAASGHGSRIQAPADVPAGLYHVTQVLTDELGAQLTVTSNVTVSLKRLVWYTGSTTYAGNHTTARGGNQGSDTSSPIYVGGERITMLQGTPGFYNALGYQFTLPSAVEYSAISFSVLGSGTHQPALGIQNRQLGTWAAGKPWIIDYFSPLSAVSTKYGWTTVSGDPTYSRIGRTVRGIVLALNWTSGGHYDVSKVKLTYRYALLK
jgi:hypothetical protein